MTMPVELNRVLYWKQIEKEHASRLGQKCYSLAHYKKASFPVPPFFAVPNTIIAQVLGSGEILPFLQNEVAENVLLLEEETGLKFGDGEKPLILATRSGDPRSLYGSLLTIPGVGLNDQTCKGLIDIYGPQAESEALWLYLDLMVDFAVNVEGLAKDQIRPLLTEMKEKGRSPSEMRELIHKAQNARRFFGFNFSFPQNVYDQLMASIRAVAFSWKSTKAQCAAIALGLDPDDPNDFPSVFAQQMIFTSLSRDSAFISLLSHPQDGTFAPATVGRRVMFGIARDILGLDDLQARNPQLYERVFSELVRPIVKMEKSPINMEIAVERGELYLIQVGPASLSPAVHIEAINQLVAEGVITEAEAVRKRGEVQRETQVTMYKVNPKASLELVAKGRPGAPGAMVGRVVLTPEQALIVKKSGKKAILFSGKPQDEDVYWLTVGRNLDGIGLTIGAGKTSHIVSFAEANGIPVVASLRSVAILPEGIKIGDRILKVGDRVVINGNEGELYAASDQEPEPVVEDRTVITLSYGINYVELLRSMRNRYRTCDYDELLALHAEGVKSLSRIDSEQTPKDEIVGLQARVHCLHLLAYEKGKLRYGDCCRGRVDMDVAVADGNFNRVQGLEDRNFLIREEEDGRYLVVTAGEVYYDFFGYITEGFTDTGELAEGGRRRGLDMRSFRDRRKLSIHSQEVVCLGVTFPREQLAAAVGFLKEFFENQ